jgi:hypothetical protein
MLLKIWSKWFPCLCVGILFYNFVENLIDLQKSSTSFLLWLKSPLTIIFAWINSLILNLYGFLDRLWLGLDSVYDFGLDKYYSNVLGCCVVLLSPIVWCCTRILFFISFPLFYWLWGNHQIFFSNLKSFSFIYFKIIGEFSLS